MNALGPSGKPENEASSERKPSDLPLCQVTSVTLPASREA